MAGLCYGRIRVAFAAVLLVLTACLVDVKAQVMSVDYERKILYMDSLQMPENTSLGMVLTVLPELLGRPGISSLSNYDILIEGMSVLDAKDAALAQLRICDIESVEVSESPTSSYQNNGQGGVVNFVLRRKDGLWGSAAIEGSYSTDVMPALTLGYAKGKWMVRALALGEYYRPYNDVREWDVDIATGDRSAIKETREKISSWGELARVYTRCNITENDVLSWNLGQYSSRTSQESYGIETKDRNSSQYQSNTTLQTLLNYSHVFNDRSNLSTEIQYIYSPTSNGYNQNESLPEDRDHRMFDDYGKTHNVIGRLSFNTDLLPAKGSKSCGLTVGVTANGSFTSGEMFFEDKAYGQERKIYSPRYNTYYLMPFAKIKIQAGKFRLSFSGEFQHLRTLINPGRLDFPDNADYTNIANDFTCKVIGEWHFDSRQCLRLIVDRKLQRPDKDQLYPVTLFNPDKYIYVRGNSDLKSESVIQLGMDYVSNYRWGRHSLQMSLAANYYNVSNLIVGYIVGGRSEGEGMVLTQEYLTFKNDGINKILAGGVMAIWRYRWLQCSATATVFHNKQEVNRQTNHYTYYNICLQPSIFLPRNWGVVSNFIYNSRVTRFNQYLGESAVLNVNLSKGWKRWSVYAYGVISLLGNTTDASASDKAVHYYEYPQVKTAGGAGIRYVF